MRDIAESKRKCRFPDEGDMLYYRNYTRNNCMLECVHRFILEACGCQPYFHPSETLRLITDLFLSINGIQFGTLKSKKLHFGV